MIKRLYVHNYKCLVNFEINFDKDISLFLGANGSGKSTIFEVLTNLRQVIIDEERVDNIFNDDNSPRWLNVEKSDIRFEVDIEIGSSIYKYLLIISIGIATAICIKKESLYCDNEKIIDEKEDDEGKTTVLLDDDMAFTFDNKTRSSINRYSKSSKKLEFLKYLRSFFIARINPYKLGYAIQKSNADIRNDFSNYAEWFAYLNEKNRRGVSEFEKAMRDILPGFDYFVIEQAGQARILQVEFENKSNKKEPIKYYFHELSEGQKILIALYTLIYCTPDNSLICIDEPENFLALPEIQPWFDTLYDQCVERNLQVILISHHPKIINFLASDSGYWFSRENNLTRVQKIVPENESGLSIAELIDRGWVYEQ